MAIQLKSAVSSLVAAGLLAISLSQPAQAALLPTEAIVGHTTPATGHDYLASPPDRDRLQARLVAFGADADLIRARVQSLSDDEVATLATRLDQLPAGGDTLEIILIIFLILLFTDILGLTDVFTFVKKPAR
jgi:hypothetical protein